MSKKKKLIIVALIALVVLSLLLFTGCPQHIDSLYGLKVTGDGDGGAIAVYEDKLGGNIYVQKISAEGKKLWGEKGTLLGTGNSKSYSFNYTHIVSDGSGGAFVAWPGPSDSFRPSSHLARIDSEGKMLWQHGFISFSQLAGDGSGGAIIAFDYDYVFPDNKDLLLVKMDSQGNYPWGLQGVPIPRQSYQDNTLKIVGDSSGGVIVVWEELESRPNSIPDKIKITNRVYAQRIDDEGKLLWGDNILLYTTPDGTMVESLNAVADGTGGLLLGWFSVTEITTEGNNTQQSQLWDIVTQKIDADGKILWQPEGIPLEIEKSGGRPTPENKILITGNDSGEAIVVWRDGRSRTVNNMSIYAQKISTDGKLQWEPGGIKVSVTSLNPRTEIISDSSGGAILAYSFNEDWKILHVQKIDGDGQALWQENGISVTEKGFTGYSISTDEQGGVILAWGLSKGILHSEKAFVQRISADGRLLWGVEGIRLNP